MDDTQNPAIDIRVRAFRADLRILEREVANALQGQGECCAVSMAQCHVLLELEGAGCINLTGLAGRMSLDKSTLSRTVDGLVNAGLVSRSTDPDNRRQQVICLSAAGKSKAAGINRLCDASYGRLFQLMPENKHQQVLESVSLLAQAMIRNRMEDCHDPESNESGTCCR